MLVGSSRCDTRWASGVAAQQHRDCRLYDRRVLPRAGDLIGAAATSATTAAPATAQTTSDSNGARVRAAVDAAAGARHGRVSRDRPRVVAVVATRPMWWADIQ
jgi:hypothetical protein